MEKNLDGIAIIDQDHRVVEANPRFAEMLGYTTEEVVGLYTWDWEAVMTEAEIRASFADLTKTSTTFETLHRRKDGTVFDVEISASGAKVGDKPLVFTICRDITERKNAEKQLQEQFKFLQTLLDTIPNPVFYKDTGGKYLGCNSAFEQFIGKPEDEIKGESVFDIAPQEIADEYYRKDEELFKNPGVQTYDWKVKNAEGGLTRCYLQQSNIQLMLLEIQRVL